PNTLGVLKTIFKFISYEEPPKAMEVLIDDIAYILHNTDIQEILQHFYSLGKGQDPIIHFYETFLSEYDPQLREKRGVYYTPEPVVRYIVRSIHSLLKSHFAQEEGFASSEVTVLDPAAGTLTFPAEAIKLAIEEYSQQYGDGSVHKLIKEHILPHFYAIELMMAPYTVGHLKTGYLLAEHGYELSEDERFKLYLSNTLEQDLPEQMLLPLLHDISEECVLANEIKYQEPILVIMGNPPYSGASENNNDWTEKLMKTHLDGAQSYYTVDGMPLGEKNPKWLQDDYVKFLRFAQWKVHWAGKGVVGMITNHGYLDNPTFRGMRQSLMDTFDEIYILDLHGNVKKKEKSPDGGKDENVFDIQQGTAIILMVKGTEDKEKKVYHQELYGAREAKYEWLEKKKFSTRNYKRIKPSSPFYLFRPETKGSEHYLKWHNLPEIFPLNSVGIVTARDGLTIKESEHELRNTIHQFAALEPEMARIAYRLGKDARDWKIEWAQRDLKESGLDDKNIVPILYRPFDTRYTYYTGNSSGFHCRPRKELMQHVLQENISIVAVRQVKTGSSWQHVFIANVISESCYISNSTSEISYVFPLYRYPNEDKEDFLDADKRQYNITSKLVSDLSRKWQAFQPEQLFYYVYAVLHSNLYRERFAQYLRLDFPRIPITEDYKLFRKISDYGKELSEIQLLQSPRLHKPIARYQGIGSNDTIEEIKYDAKKGTVRINPDKYFEGIKPELWDYQIGAYQVLHKYLKDRKGKELKDPVHYCQMVSALSLCLELQAKIDKGIGELLK
ncbi:MAG: N-6 DNA methylase, partial [Candidatus Cloacimonetes bacterium]|nr:N-6 DNA methylase [Candidatus Cloacimonadota bacterium]